MLSGVLTRNEALAQLSQPFATADELEQTRAYVAKKLALSDDEFQRIWLAPTQKTFDYPSNYALIFSLVRKFRPVLKKLYAFTPMSVTASDVIGAKS